MSERPLFQNADEQEAAYAPQQAATGSDVEGAADVDLSDSAVLPAAPAAEASMTGIGPSAEAYGLGSGAPSVASTAGVSADDDADAPKR